jgi:hypothetical protein
MNVKSWAMSIGSPIREAGGKIIIAYVVPVTFSHPMHSSCIASLLNVESGIELGYDHHIPVIVNAHKNL